MRRTMEAIAEHRQRQMWKEARRLKAEQINQCLLLFSDPEDEQPFFIEMFDGAPKKGVVDLLRLAERGGRQPWLRKIRQIMALGRLPDVLLLEKGLDSVTHARWGAFQQELSKRLMEEVPQEPTGVGLPDGVVVTLGDGAEVMLDETITAVVMAHHWRAVNAGAESTKVIHACKEVRNDCPVFASSLHRFVVNAAPDQVVWHRNGQYNNCLSNLIRYCDNPSNERRQAVSLKLNALIEERKRRRGRPKKLYYWQET